MKGYLLLILLILLTIVGGIYLVTSSSESKTKVELTAQNLKLLKCQEVVVAKGTCNVKAKVSQRQELFGVTLPDFAPGSKSASYEGPMHIRFGYDSTMLLFPQGTKLESENDVYIITIPNFPRPIVLADPAMRGYVKESSSYFTGDIPAESFFHYLDSLSVVAGEKTISAHEDYFRDAYAHMVFSIVKPLMGSNDFIIHIGGNVYDGKTPLQEPKQEFVEDIEAEKKL